MMGQLQRLWRLSRLMLVLLAAGIFIGLVVETTVSDAQAINEKSPLTAQSLTIPLKQNDIEINVDEVVASGFASPIQVTHAGDGSGRLFVVEQGGEIEIIENDTVLGTPFLDISDLVLSGGERGLLGLAFHPDYKNNGYFFVNYTRDSDGATVIARYSVSGDPNIADPNNPLVLLTIDQPASNHNGGQLLFGPDGYLYIGMGDGGGSNDQFDNAQDKNTLLGAMLRIDVDNPANGENYGIPADNPYVSIDGADEIWAIGLRNPWRFSFDRQTGDLYIGDVGQGPGQEPEDGREEIDFQAAGTPGGLNFGWPCREGTIAGPDDCMGDFTDPIVDYVRTEGRSVTGGFVYRGSFYPALVGYYFYADFITGKIWSLRNNGTNWVDEEELDEEFNISAFGEDEAGELYVVDYSNGQIRRLADVNGVTPNLSPSSKSATPASAEPGATFTYTIRLENSTGPLTETLFLNDTLPDGLAYVTNTLTASGGTVDDTQAPTLKWQGTLTPTPLVTLTYQVTATGLVTGALTNQAVVTGATISPLTLTKTVFVPTVETIYLPLILK